MPYITHADGVIFGLGSNNVASVIDAKSQLSAAYVHLLRDDENSGHELGSWMRASSLKTTPCTDALANLVAECGGACGFQIVDGVADVWE